MFFNFKIINKKFKKYRIEIALLCIAFFLTIVSLIIFLGENNKSEENEILITKKTNQESFTKKKIFVEISGAVAKPDVYEITFGTRLKDILIKAGGLSDNADKDFFYRNFNLARIVNDQEKYYIPSLLETANGIFIENKRTIDYTLPAIYEKQLALFEDNQTDLININNASLEELDQLPGIGKVTAQKIIQNRPYQSIEELLTKKVVNKSVYEKIKELVTID